MTERSNKRFSADFYKSWGGVESGLRFQPAFFIRKFGYNFDYYKFRRRWNITRAKPGFILGVTASY